MFSENRVENGDVVKVCLVLPVVGQSQFEQFHVFDCGRQSVLVRLKIEGYEEIVVP